MFLRIPKLVFSPEYNSLAFFFFFFYFSTIHSFANINVHYIFSKIIDPWLFKNLFIAVLKTVWKLCGSKQQFYFVYQFTVRNLKWLHLTVLFGISLGGWRGLEKMALTLVARKTDCQLKAQLRNSRTLSLKFINFLKE